MANWNPRCCRHLFCDIGSKPLRFHCHFLTNLDGIWKCQKLLPFVLWHWMQAIYVPFSFAHWPWWQMAMPDVAAICYVTLGASHLGSIIICSITLMAYINPRCCCHLFCDVGCKPFRFHCSLLTLIAYGNARCCRHLFCDIGCKPFWFHFHLLTNLDSKWQCQKLLPFVLWH